MRRYIKQSFLLVAICMISVKVYSQAVSRYITVDQFGYLPESKKIATIRDPQVGYDAGESFEPGEAYVLVNAETSEQVFSGSLVAWNNGKTDQSSGDRLWHFDFSEVATPGNYYILDVSKNVRSFKFNISAAIYNEVLRQAVRTFFYQRAGFAKQSPFADAGWEDGASHIGSDQDTEAHRYDKPNDDSLERDLHGGWYDAGDYNKYTNWTANYVVELLKAYEENPEAWSDDYNLPESGNGLPDILDEVKWGLDYLLRLQESDGSVISIVGLASGSPPSSATGASYYGLPSTSATLNSASAYATGALRFESLDMTDYANTLKEAALMAWDWAENNPAVLFYNNDNNYGTQGLGAGQQEVDDYGRLMAKLEAAVYLFELTGDTVYKEYFDSNYEQCHLIAWNYAYPFELTNQEVLLRYVTLQHATESVKENIIAVYNHAMAGNDNLGATESDRDPYHAFIKDYTWGSNGVKAAQALMYIDMHTFATGESLREQVYSVGEGYVHYLHGVNPFNLVYLSNMYAYGGENCVNEFYHTWFADGSAQWDRVGESAYGPAPGFLTGGPNPSYDWDGCCPDDCGSTGANNVCTTESLEPPQNQPDQKSYKDFNTSWPLNSWSVTENSGGYQVNYIRLLSKFVTGNFDCNGDKNGVAQFDACGRCAGGNTGLVPVNDPGECGDNSVTGLAAADSHWLLYPNPVNDNLTIKGEEDRQYEVKLLDLYGHQLSQQVFVGSTEINLSHLPNGSYIVLVETGNQKPTMHHFLKIAE